jgi:molecular chaperone GrpE (heat shock protein)
VRSHLNSFSGWQRAKADLLNARKRDEEEKKEYIKFANERMIEDLLPVLQSFDMAMGNKEAWEKADKNWRILRCLGSTLWGCGKIY